MEEINNLKDIPISLCLVNFTENNIITSITCPESLPISKKQEMIFHFIKYLNLNEKKKGEKEINITKNKEIIDNNQYIKEKKIIKCNNENIYSICFKEINKTIDLKGNLNNYEELFFINTTNDEFNSYIKNIKTKIYDNTNDIKDYSPDNYNIILNKLLSKLKPYLKVEKQFSNDIKSNNNSLRYLNNETKYIINEENLFSYTPYNGIKLSLDLKNNGGYNTESMDTYIYLLIDDLKKELVNIKQFSNFNRILNKLIILYKAGNNLSSKLYQNLKINLNNISQDITNSIIYLKNNIAYKDLTEIMDSTHKINKLPYNTIEKFNDLENELKNLLIDIDNNKYTKKITIINQNIYDFISKSHIIINNIFKSFNNFTLILKSSKNEIAEISNYYLNNNTSYPYINIINKVKNILFNYYKNEKDLITPKIELIIKELENNLKASIGKESNIIKDLYLKIKNKNITIENANDEDYTKILSSISNSNNYINNIINNLENKIKNEIKLKDSDYFITNYEIKSNNESFNYIINDSLNMSNKIENNETIDKTFDDIMIKFKENFTYIQNYMDIQKEEQFPLDENILKDSLFTLNEQKNITNQIKELSSSILNKLEKENDYYLNEINKVIDKFIEENKDYLNNLIDELDIIFSEDILKRLAISYDIAFESSLNKIKNNIKENEILSNNYFNDLYNILENDTRIIEILAIYDKVNQTIPCIKTTASNYIVYGKYINHNDTIIKKTITKNYLEKYNHYKNNIDNSIKYINQMLKRDLYNEYKKNINKIKELFTSIKNNNIINHELSKKTKLFFIEYNLKRMNFLNERFDKYLSDILFNNKYQTKLNDFKLNQTIIPDKLKNFEITSNDFINID